MINPLAEASRRHRCLPPAAPDDFANRSVIDLGSPQGELSFECVRRGAQRVVGFQSSDADVDFCTTKALRHGIVDRCEFRRADLRQILDSPLRQRELLELCGPADIVFCSALNLDCKRVCEFVGRLTVETCYLELTTANGVQQIMDAAQACGFQTVAPLGRDRSFRRRGLRFVILDKKVPLSERIWQRRYRGYRLGERYLKEVLTQEMWDRFSRRYLTPNSHYDHRTYQLGDRYIREFASRELWEKVRSLYARIAHIPYVQECEFSVPGRLTSPLYAQNLAEADLTERDKDRFRPQAVQLIRQLNEAGIAHRDLHCGNIFLDDGQIRLVDMEYLEVDRSPLSECYDLTGRGLECPLKSGRMNAFKEFPLSLKNVIGLTPSDFGLPATSADQSESTRRAA